MRSVTLVNYDGNASTNELRPVEKPFNLSLRCDHYIGRGGADDVEEEVADTLGCMDIVHADITCTANGSMATTTPLPLTRTDHYNYSILTVTVPAHTIGSQLGVLAFTAANEWGFRSSAAHARKYLERLRIASRSRGLGSEQRTHYHEVVTRLSNTLTTAQFAPLTAVTIIYGNQTFNQTKALLQAEVANISTSLNATTAQAMAATAKAGHNATFALATGTPLGKGWRRLGVADIFNETVGYGWTNDTATQQRTLVTSLDHTKDDGIHGSYIGGKTPSTLRLQIPQVLTHGVVTLISGSADTGRQAATTAIRVSGCLGGQEGAAVLPGDYDYSGFYRHVAFRFNVWIEM